MAEEQTSAQDAPETSQEQSQTSENTAPQQPAASSKVNLQEIPEFKNYQAQFTRTVNGLQAELQQLKAAQAAARMEGMDELERANFLLQQKEEEIGQYRQQMQQAQIAQQRFADLQNLSSMTGAPMDALNVASTYDEAVKLSIQWMKENGATKSEIAAAKKEANAVDLGGGGASTPQDREAKERAELLKSGNTRELFKRMFEG